MNPDPTTVPWRRRVAVMVAAATVATIAPASADHPGVHHLLRDDFAGAFSTGPAAPWSLFRFDNPPAGTYLADDGMTETSPSSGLRVRAAGTDPTTGDPVFTRTMDQEDDNAFALPGQLDHFKWLALATRPATSGWPGYDAPAGRELVLESSVAGRTFGTERHPFGATVADSEDDLRLGALTTIAFDAETQLGFGFVLTNRRIYAWYECQQFARARLGNYTAFAFAVPVADRGPERWADLAIAYEPSTATVRWLVGNRELFRLQRPGELIDRRWMVLDNGGTPGAVVPRQLTPGFGLMTFLDGAAPGTVGLVRLSNLPFHYFDTAAGPPAPQLFVDNSSVESNRLFGQGAELRLRRLDVHSRSRPSIGEGGRPSP